MIRLLSFLLLTIAFNLPAQAQSSGGGQPKVRFLAERFPGELGQVLLAAEEKRGKPFNLPVNQLSDPMTTPARLFSLRTVDKDLSLVDITLPETGKSFIVLLIPSAESGFKHVVITDGDPKFQPGDMYFYNHSNKTVMGFVGTAKFVIAPARGQILRPTGAKPERYYDVGLGVREAEGDRVLSTTRWPENKGMRYYVFFFVNPKTQRVDFRAVDEYVSKDRTEDSP